MLMMLVGNQDGSLASKVKLNAVICLELTELARNDRENILVPEMQYIIQMFYRSVILPRLSMKKSRCTSIF